MIDCQYDLFSIILSVSLSFKTKQAPFCEVQTLYVKDMTFTVQHLRHAVRLLAFISAGPSVNVSGALVCSI